MKTKLGIIIISSLAINLSFTSCTENPKDNDPTSTITPGGNIQVDTVTAHRNNTDSTTQVKNNRADSAAKKSQ